MPLQGEYEPSPSQWAADQVSTYERSGGTEGNAMQSVPVIILHTRGRHSGKVRKAPLMRVEHDGTYAAIASLGGAPKHPVWYLNLVADPHVALQDGPDVVDYQALGERCRARGLVGAGGRGLAGLRELPDEDRARDPGRAARTNRRLNLRIEDDASATWSALARGGPVRSGPPAPHTARGSLHRMKHVARLVADPVHRIEEIARLVADPIGEFGRRRTGQAVAELDHLVTCDPIETPVTFFVPC